ncbi:hypothetical protein NDU88_005565 [Pleurodeles waltl]|uniref:Uncharacterized protein n=1 Tax=Pleurodeles waltl TaxID=8319 RepID=A0AAV7RLF1_PLEWA|nr:hypothetical protein NDU88_005565 [Pleurodeles waltl]
MAAPININEEEVVVISDEEEEVQADQVAVPSGCDASHVLGEHGERPSHRQFGRLTGEQSLPVKVRAPLTHQAEGRVKPGAVYPTSRELAGVGPLGQRSGLEDVQSSTSQGAGGGLYPIEEELLDYDDDVEEEVLPIQQGDVVKSRDVPRVVQGDHSGAHRQELVAGNLPRGEERVLGLSGSKVVREVMGGTLQKGVQGVLHEKTLSKVDASIQVALGALTELVLCGLWDTRSFAGRRSKLHRVILGSNWV